MRLRSVAAIVLAGVLLEGALSAQTPDTEAPAPGVVEFGSFDDLMPSANDQPTVDATEALRQCAGNLKRIGEAILAYRSAHQGRNPVWLSDLYPEYAPNVDLFLCPADAQRGDSGFGDESDEGLPTSYLYEFSPSRYDTASHRYRTYGSVAPVVRCWHHLDVPTESGQGETVLTLDYAGNVEGIAPEWETDTLLVGRLYETIRDGVRSGDTIPLAAIHFGALDLLDDDQRREITELLEPRANATSSGGIQKLRGAFARRAGRSDEAIAAYESAARQLPDDPEVHFLLGVLYRQVGRRDEARASYERGLLLQPDTVDILRELASFYASDGNDARVQELYALLKTVFRPQSFGHRLVMADVAYAAGDATAALESYEWLLTRYPKGASLEDTTLRHIALRVADLYDRSGRTAQAEKLRVAIEPGRALIAKPAPPITGVDAQGNAVTLAFGAKPVVLVFWGSWGDSCEAQLETMRKVQERFGTENLAVVGVNAAETVEPEVLFASVHGQFQQIYDAGTGYLAYQIRVIPTTVTVDRNGVVQDYVSGYRSETDEALFERIERLLAIPAPVSAPSAP